MTEITPEAALERAEAEQAAWANAPKLRLFYCKICHQLIEVPWLRDPREALAHPDAPDPYLDPIVEQHMHGRPEIAEHASVMDVPVVLWNNPQERDRITQQIYAELSPGLDAIAPGYYDVKNQYSADALRCYVQHNQPKDGSCSDWHAKRKQIVPDTKAERKDLGLSAVPDGPKQYICSFCPIAIVRQQRAYDQAGGR